MRIKRLLWKQVSRAQKTEQMVSFFIGFLLLMAFIIGLEMRILLFSKKNERQILSPLDPDFLSAICKRVWKIMSFMRVI